MSAARFRWLAAIQRARLAGVLPDPMVTGGYMRVPSMRMDGLMVEVEQPLPRWGGRDAERAMATAQVTMADAEYALARGQVLARTSTFLVEADAALAQVKLDNDIAQRARILADLLARSAVAVGKGTVREPLSLLTRAGEFELMAARDARMAADALGEAAAMLGLAPGTKLPEIALPDPLAITPSDSPEVRMARARITMAAADQSMAEARGRPEVAVMGRWRQVGEDDADSWEGGLRVSIPLWRDAYGGGTQAARSSAAAARREFDGAILDAREMLARAQRAQDLAERTRTWSSETAERLERELDTLATETATGMAGATAMLFDRFDQLIEARRAVIAADAEARRARAALWALAPPPLPSSGNMRVPAP